MIATTKPVSYYFHENAEEPVFIAKDTTGARTIIVVYIGYWHNRRRLHSSLGQGQYFAESRWEKMSNSRFDKIYAALDENKLNHLSNYLLTNSFVQKIIISANQKNFYQAKRLLSNAKRVFLLIKSHLDDETIAWYQDIISTIEKSLSSLEDDNNNE